MENRIKFFEEWIVDQMGEHVKVLIGTDNFHEEDGYIDQTINAMWLGFNAGIEVYPLI